MKFNKTKKSTEDRRKENFAGGESFEASTPETKLVKLAVNNLLEDKYYESDEESMQRLVQAVKESAKKDKEFPLKVAYFAREDMYIRQVPQLILVVCANIDETKDLVKEYTPKVIQRADEINTVIATQLELYGKPIPKPLKKGVRKAFHNFDRYHFAKYNNLNKEVKFRDVMNLVHPKPQTEDEEEIFEKLIKGDLDDYPRVEPLEPPETWEVVISEKGNNAEAWREVLPKMGLFAKIRNIRNMLDVGISGEEIFDNEDMDHVKNSKIYPFRFYQAYSAMKEAGHQSEYLEDWLSEAIDVTAENIPNTLDNTFVAVDLSGSMDSPLSRNSNMTYKEISSLFGAILGRKGAKVTVFGNDFDTVEAHHRTPTLELMEKIKNKNVGHSTNGWKAIACFYEDELYEKYDRIVILTDMEIWDSTYGYNSNTVKDHFDKVREESDVNLYMVDLSSYGDLVTPEGYQGVYNIQGWNSKIIDWIESIENPREMIHEIKNIEVGD